MSGVFTSGMSAQEDARKPYIIKNIYFSGGSYYIDEVQRSEVMSFLEGIILDNFEIHIHSHTDNVGGVEYNQWLSRMRSEATLMMLRDEGIPLDKLFIRDHGLWNPDFDNDTWEGRLKNRRVDIILWPLPA